MVGTDAIYGRTGQNLLENTFRDVIIALANEFALICEKLGEVNVFEQRYRSWKTAIRG